MKILFSLISVFLFIFAMQAFGLFSLKFWGVKYENARREVFEETKSYKHGTIRDLQNLMLEYQAAESEAHKSALRSVILHRSAAFDPNELTPELRQFLSTL